MNKLKLETTLLNQTEKHLTRSNKYEVITSGEIADVLKNNNLYLHNLVVTGIKDREFATHHMRFRFKESLDILDKKVYIPEIVVTNSYNGRSSLQFRIGIYRIICSNGLVVGNDYYTWKVRHINNEFKNIPNIISKMVKAFKSVDHKINQMRDRELNEVEIRSFIYEALKIRLGLMSNTKIHTLINPEVLLRARRAEDCSNKLWHVYNKVQEGLIRGSDLRYTYTSKKGELKTGTVRQIKSPQSQLVVNTKLWNVSEKLLKAS